MRRMITEYGAAVYGSQPIPADVLLDITLAADIVDAWSAQTNAPDFVQWREKHPQAGRLLDMAERILNG